MLFLFYIISTTGQLFDTWESMRKIAHHKINLERLTRRPRLMDPSLRPPTRSCKIVYYLHTRGMYFSENFKIIRILVVATCQDSERLNIASCRSTALDNNDAWRRAGKFLRTARNNEWFRWRGRRKIAGVGRRLRFAISNHFREIHTI